MRFSGIDRGAGRAGGRLADDTGRDEIVAEREVVRPRPWRSWGVWAPLLVAGASALRLWAGSSIVGVDVTLVVVGVVVLAMTLVGGVEVGPDGIRARRLTRKRRTATWDEIDRFVGDTKEPPSVLLTDGTHMRLFDYAGDGERVAAQLEDARDRYLARS